MKRLLLTICLLIGVASVMAQTATAPPAGSVPAGTGYRAPDGSIWIGSGTIYKKIALAADVVPATITGATISSLPVVGQVITTGTPDEVFRQLYAQSQVPTASLSGGGVYEFHSAGTFGVTLNYTAGRQGATQPFAAFPVGIVVASTAKTFTQPSAPGSVSGSQAVTVTYNTNTSYSMTVTTTDSKTASASTSFQFKAYEYWGFASSRTVSDATIQGLSKSFKDSRNNGGAVRPSTTPSGSQYFTISFPESFDPSGVTQIWIGGLDQTATFERTVRSFTNASGYVSNYIVYIGYSTTSGSISFDLR